MNKVIIFFIMVISMIMMGCCCRTHEYQYTRSAWHPVPFLVVPIYLDESFGNADRVEIVKAVEQWNYVLNGHIELRVVQQYMNPGMFGHIEMADIYRSGGIMIVRSYGGNRFKMDKEGKFILAFCDHVGGNIVYVLRDRVNNWDMYWLMMHEIGHILGASHDKLLMAPYYNPEDYACVDKATAAQVAKHFNLVNDLNYCQ